jgi:hypothetical protein
MASTIRKAQANTIARAQFAAAVKPTLNDRISIEPNTLTEKTMLDQTPSKERKAQRLYSPPAMRR